MKIDLPYVSRERTREKWRYRFQRGGQKVTLKGTPGSAAWLAHYQRLLDGAPASPQPRPRSLPALVADYLEWLDQQVKAGQASPLTLKQRRAFLLRLAAQYPDHRAQMTVEAVLKSRDEMAATPGHADNMVKAIRAMYAWAVPRKKVAMNPAAEVARINTRSRGFTPWSGADLKA